MIRVVKNSDKQRFALREAPNLQIRANQGHTMQVCVNRRERQANLLLDCSLVRCAAGRRARADAYSACRRCSYCDSWNISKCMESDQASGKHVSVSVGPGQLA